MAWKTLGIIPAFVLAIGWFVWPYYSAAALVQALRTSDRAQLEQRIDWPTLRQGLRDDLNAYMLKASADASSKDNPGAGFAAVLGPLIVDRMIDAYVTPAGLVALLSGSKPTADGTNVAAPPATKSVDLHNVRYAFFAGLTTFRVDMAGEDGPGTVTLLFRWSGHWRLSRIFLPLETD
jgi:hypothetical protein